MKPTPLWASETFWKKAAIWVTAASFIILTLLTFNTLKQTTAGGSRVPDYTVINQKIDYQYRDNLHRSVPVIGDEELLFGTRYSQEEALQLVDQGKKTVQAKNCMNCHTLLGNGAYYAPDLTKAWLDKGWINVENRESMMLRFLLDPAGNPRTFGNGRRMPSQHLTEEEAKAVMAFLKWMSSIDTNGFPHQFKTLYSEE